MVYVHTDLETAKENGVGVISQDVNGGWRKNFGGIE